MKSKFKWIDWNINHIAEHGISPDEAESVFDKPVDGYPRKHKDGYTLWGKSILDQWLQIGFTEDEDNSIFVFHARPLTPKERKRIK